MISKEAEIIIHSCKQVLTEDDKDFILKNVDEGINWGEFLYICVHHRVTSLVWRTFSELNILSRIERHVYKIMRGEYIRIKKHNDCIYNEMKIINEKFLENGVEAVLLKGALLSKYLYQDTALREFGDIDYLIKIDQIPSATTCLSDLGYKQGHYNEDKKKVEEVSKKERILHRMNSHEIVEFIKVIDNDFCNMVATDINFDIFWKGNNKDEHNTFDIKELFDHLNEIELDGVNIYMLQPEYQLIQLCAHLYSEAVFFPCNKRWLRDKGDLNLIKYCDIYEIIKSCEIDWDNLRNIIDRNRINIAMFYVLSSLNQIFNNTVPQAFLNSLKVKPDVLDLYYDEEGKQVRWNLSFMDRMFKTQEKYNNYIANVYH